MDIQNYLPFWDKLSTGQKSVLTENSNARKIAKDTVIHNGNLDCTGLIIVRSGRLRAFITSEEGREITLYRLFDSDMCLFSASCMLHSISFEVTITAETDSDVIIIPTEVYRKLMEESAPVANFTNELMASRFSDVMWLMEQVMWKSLDKRLAAFLLEESEVEDTHTLKTTHETIANHLGSSREVITRMLRYFQSECLVKLSRGTVTLTDISGLQRIVRD
ncbi:MAG: Crp/Fnr family transcriptional regulator [Clostridiales bacterium]|nr:Crp/Fnr family transcriptional regulator [Clostridiales bacterium]